MCFVLSPSKDDAPDRVPPITTSDRDDLRAILGTVEPLDLPDVGFDAGILQLADCLNHQPGVQLKVVSLLVAMHAIKLGLLRGHQEFEHEQAPTSRLQVLGQPA